MFRKLLLVAVTAGYAWLIWRMTLTPQVFSATEHGFVARVLSVLQAHDVTSWVTYGRAEFMANIAMFVPVGAILAMWLPRRAWVVAAGGAVVLSVGIELFQLAALPSRVADPRDVLSNGVGGVLGVVMVAAVRGMLPRRSSRPRARVV